jgi:hypothetical protein
MNRPAGPRPRDDRLPPEGHDRLARRALVLVVALAFLVVVAIWKPWEGGGNGTVQSTVPPGASGSLLPAITGVPGSEASPVGS